MLYRERRSNVDFKPEVAEAFVTDFALLPGSSDAVEEVQRLAKKHKLRLTQVNEIAHAIWKTPDVRSKTQVVSLPHKPIARRIWLALSGARERNSTIWLQQVKYMRTTHPAAILADKEFTAADYRSCRHHLEELADAEDAHAMTLLGQLLVEEKQPERAKELFEDAISLYQKQVKPGYTEYLAQVPPWNCLGILSLSENTPESLDDAKRAFATGALKCDDPVSYYCLAKHFEPKHTSTWLKYMTKAAGRGHTDAMYAVADFYLLAETGEEPGGKLRQLLVADSKLSRALRWLTESYRKGKGGPKEVANEWLVVAAEMGHKPSMIRLAENLVEAGKMDAAKRWYEAAASPPQTGTEEKWPELAVQAKRSLQKGMWSRT
ncbi:hypothetical protein M011DRAFT_473807 [Sporormia fimetaria CBS 119925]|uniref:Uncharacterized protein n=1 Tax=Sporormia fimetaria CBS 119925 TaxID=1340428 RepID=A0A6A6VMD5_9PLEO|nr:hypothetical protein M011DRAFT_473807 [Sporormia fimetaria CBS 119925]